MRKSYRSQDRLMVNLDKGYSVSVIQYKPVMLFKKRPDSKLEFFHSQRRFGAFHYFLRHDRQTKRKKNRNAKENDERKKEND